MFPFLLFRLLHSCYDDASKFVYLLAKPGCSYLEQEDFIPLLQVSSVCVCVCVQVCMRVCVCVYQIFVLISCSFLSDHARFFFFFQDIVDTHPGLTFLKDAPEFHSRYITTVRHFHTVILSIRIPHCWGSHGGSTGLYLSFRSESKPWSLESVWLFLKPSWVC